MRCPKPHDECIARVKEKAYALGYWSIMQTDAAHAGHVTSCLSAIDIVATLFFGDVMRYDPHAYHAPYNDRFILSKGHAAPLLYAVWHELGMISTEQLRTYRQYGSLLEGHPTRRFPFADAATGSLGIGLSIGLGYARAAQLNRSMAHTYVLMGDGECAEGSVYEAAEIAGYYNVPRLMAIIDQNRLGQSSQTIAGNDGSFFERLFSACGWRTYQVDGHDIPALLTLLYAIRTDTTQPGPVAVIAHTKKGHAVSSVEDKEGFHGKPFSQENITNAYASLSNYYNKNGTPKIVPYVPPMPDTQGTFPITPPASPSYSKNQNPSYAIGSLISTRYAYGEALVAIGIHDQRILSLDGDVSNSTYAALFAHQFPERFMQCFIAEQNMVSMAVGLTYAGYIPFVSTFGAFLSRACDQLRMAAIGTCPLRLVGSHAGVSVGQDGPSQMALEDIAIIRTLPNSIILYPCDAVSTAALVPCMATYTKGISYLRTTRDPLPVIYHTSQPFHPGGSHVLRASNNDQACIVAAGITVHEALKAYDILRSQDIPIMVSVIDLYSIKPFDYDTVVRVAHDSADRLVIVEDHYRAGGIGEMVQAALTNIPIKIISLAVDTVPCSGSAHETLSGAKIDAQQLVTTVNRIIVDQ